MPKLYFYDTGLAAYLLDIRASSQIMTHYARSALFEQLIICEILKQRFNQGHPANIHFWRDKNGHEIDCLVERGESLLPIEIKAGRTVTPDYFRGVDYFMRLAGDLAARPYVVYGGDKNRKRSQAEVLAWDKMDNLNF